MTYSFRYLHVWMVLQAVEEVILKEEEGHGKIQNKSEREISFTDDSNVFLTSNVYRGILI